MMDEFENIAKSKQNNVVEGVVMLSNYLPKSTHEEAYLKVRAKENRVLSDEAVKKLPDLPKKMLHSAEWALRKQTAVQFYDYLNQQKSPQQILDLGCGNGWFSAKMASFSPIKVVGLDLNLPELQQAQRLFGNENLLFCYGNIFDKIFENESFDKVVLNASVQYFPSIEYLFKALFCILKPEGEIHILDSPLYETYDLREAKEKTVDYYRSMGFPEMAKHYFHHTFQDLAPFFPEYLKKDMSFWHILLRKPQNPFQWVMVKKNGILK